MVMVSFRANKDAWHNSVDLLSLLQFVCSERGFRPIAKFHYTGPTGPDRTRTDFFAVRVSEKLRWVRAGLRQSPCGSVRVRAGPVGSV